MNTAHIGLRTRSLLPRITICQILMASCLIVSIPVFFNPSLRTVFTASQPHRFPWWFITGLFVHDNQVIPLYLHLIGNLSRTQFLWWLKKQALASTLICKNDRIS